MEVVKELKNNEWKTKEDLISLQALKLGKLLLHAYKTVPYYRERFDRLGIAAKDLRNPECLSQIQLLTKKDINDNLGKLVSSGLNDNKLIPTSTSGSTGEALYLYVDMRSQIYRRAEVIRNQEWVGIRVGDRTGTIWGAPMDLNKARTIRGRLHSWVNNMLFLSSYELSDKSLELYEKKLNRFRPALLVSYPGPLTVFAEYLLGKGRGIPSIKAIISSAETLYPWQKELIESAFQTPVYNRYGCREFGDLAHECSKREGLHISIDRVFLEILDSNFEPVPPGETGEIVITDLENYGMPLIRYRIGDMGSLAKNSCSCGRGLPVIQQVEGRTLDIVRTPSGNSVGGTFWTILFRSQPGIKAFQIIQENIDEILIKYVSDTQADDPPLDLFVKRIQDTCGADFSVHFQRVSSISKTPAGKTRFVVSKLKDV
jgi:phenylacetate-CoA ligase